MSERCEPPPELRERDGWHWLAHPKGALLPEMWRASRGMWEWFGVEGESAPDGWRAKEDYRYLTPVTPPATVAALVEALEAITTHAQKVDSVFTTKSRWTFRDYGLQGREGFNSAKTLDKARAALALYRGEAGR